MDIKSAKDYLKSRGLKNPPIDSGISGGGDAPRVYVSDIMKEYAAQFIDLAAEKINNFDTLVDTYDCVNPRNKDVSELILNLKKQIK